MQPEQFAALTSPSSPEHFAATLDALCRGAGFQHFLAVRLRGNDLQHTIQVIENAPDGTDVKSLRHWSVVRMLDRMRRAGPPVVFGAGTEPGIELAGYASGVAAFVREARGGSVFFFGHSAPALPAALVLPGIQTVILAAQYGLQGLSQLHIQACPLSDQQLQCLHHFVNGRSAKETARTMQLSPRTVEHYLEAIRARFGVESTLAAAFHAIDHGWIDMPSSGSGVATG